MKGVLVLLSLTAAILAAPSPDPQLTVTRSQSSGIISGNKGVTSWGFSSGDAKKDIGKSLLLADGRREGDGRREVDSRRESDGWREREGRREGNDGRNGGNRGPVFGREDSRSDDSEFPHTIGREGLGYMKRNFRALAMRFPITAQEMEPLGYRETLKELNYVPLTQYN